MAEKEEKRNVLFRPLTDIGTRVAETYGNFINPPNEEGNRFKGFMHGAAEGAGGLVNDMTSPFGIATSLLGAPWVKGLMRSGGLLGKGVQSLGRLDEVRGINPSMLPEELIPRGGEGLFNTARAGRVATEANRLEDLAVEGSRNAQRVRVPVGGDVNVAELMAKLNAFRGK